MTSDARAGRPDSHPDARPLVVTSDPALLDELLQLCGAAARAPVVAADPGALRRGWPAASVVLLGADLAEAARELPQRPRVVLVGSITDRLWEVAADVGAEHVAVLPSAAAWLLGLLTAQPAGGANHCRTVCVMGGQGGAGATTLAATLARAAAGQGLSVLLIDADPYGGGVDLALGMEAADGDRWPQAIAADDPGSLAGAGGFIDRLPARSGLRVLAVDRDHPAQLTESDMAVALREGQRRCELVILDLPRRVDRVTIVALREADRSYLVVPAQVRAIAAAAQVAAGLGRHTARLEAVVRGPSPGSLSLEAVTRSLGIPLAAAVRAEPGLDRDYERGVPPGQPRGPLSRLAKELLRQLEANERQRPAA